MIKNLINNLDNKFKIYFSILLVLMPVMMMLETLSIATVFPILSSLSTSGNPTANYEFLNNFLDYKQLDRDEFLIYLIFFFLFIIFFKNLLLIFYTIFEGKTVYNFQEYLSSKIFSILISQSYLFHVNSKSSDFVAKIKNEISNFTLVIISILSILAEGFILIGIMVLLILFDYKIFLQLFLFLTISIGFFYLILYKKIKFLGYQRLKFELLRQNYLTESFNGIRELKIFKLSKTIIKNYQQITDQIYTISSKNFFYIRFPRVYLELILIIIIFLLVTLNIDFINNLTFKNSIPLIGVYFASAYRVLPSANRIMNAFNNYRHSKPSVKQIIKLLKLKKKNQNTIIRKFTNFKKISFQKISFYYSKKDYVLKEINLEIKKGDKIFLQGKTGVGKSTLLNILFGLLEPKSGKIKIDNQILNSKFSLLSNYISYVPQEIFLFDQSIKKNIALNFDKKINFNFFLECCKISRLDEFLLKLKKNHDINVGESGLKLSGGQRQRIGIARALYNKSKILVLDEATSSLDKSTELSILKKIFKEKNDEIIILISHNDDLKNKLNFNRILKIKHKRLIEIKK